MLSYRNDNAIQSSKIVQNSDFPAAVGIQERRGKSKFSKETN